MSDVSDRPGRSGLGAAVVMLALVLAGCHQPVAVNLPAPVTGVTASDGGPTSASTSGQGLDDDVAAARLAALSAAGRSAASAAIKELRVQGRAPKTGYSRAMFGAAWSDEATGVLWSGNGCSTRDDLLARDLDQVTKKGRCVVVAGRYVDPYSGDEIVFSKATAQDSPIDHVVPLSFAWQMGAAQWSADKRLQFANDPLNLVTTVGSLNTAKSDSDPASYLPPNKVMRCAYVNRFALVCLKYGLGVTSADEVIMGKQCAG